MSDHLEYLQRIANHDVEVLYVKEASYHGSWKKRGGIGAFMMLARKWDRIEAQVGRLQVQPNDPTLGPPQFDIFAHAEADRRDEGLIDDIRDLRRYLLLVEAELEARHGA